MCKERIEKAARSVKGIATAVWNINTKKIAVVFAPKETGIDAIK